MNTFRNYYHIHKSEIDALLLDIDGTVLIGPDVIGEAAEFIDELRQDKTPFFFLTNDGNNSHEKKCSYLNNCGINASPENIISCVDVLKENVEKNNYNGKKFFVLGVINENALNNSGIIKCTDIQEIDECYGILNGEGFYDWRPNLEAAMGFLMDHPDAPWIVTNPDSYWHNSRTGKFSVGAGGQARFIQNLLQEMNIQATPCYLGKPYPGIYDHAVNRLQSANPDKKIERRRIFGIGDYLNSDVKGARLNGITSVFLLSGVSKISQLETIPQEFHPHLIFDRLA